MSLATSNRDGGKTSESGHLRAIMKGLKAQVLTGLNVSQRGAGANMSVDVAIGDAVIPRSDGTYGHPAWNDAVYNQPITTADVSNPRRDIVVMYIDYNNAVSSAVSNNTNGVVKIMVVAGTPAGSPTDPSNAAIQSAVGSGNPYIKLARVRVGAGVTTISNSVIDDLRLMAQGLLQGGWTYDDLYTWAYASATTFTIAGVDVTAQFPVGTKLALYQGGVVKYFTVASSAFATNTTITVDGAGVYTLANVPIDRPAYSYAKTPQGFPTGEANVPFYNPYKFAAYCSAGKSITNNTLIVDLQTELFDTNNNFASSRYTAPVPMFMHIDAQAWMGVAGAGSAEYCNIQIRKNGATVKESMRHNGSDNANRLMRPNVSCIVELAAGDYIEMWGQFTGSRDIVAGQTNTFMEGFLISRK